MSPARRAAAIAVGAAVPALVSGRAVMAVLLGLAFVLAAGDRGAVMRGTVRLLRSPLGVALGALFVLWLPATIGSFDAWVSFQVWGRMVLFVPLGAALVAWLAANPACHRLALNSLVVSSLVAGAILVVGPPFVPDLIALLAAKPLGLTPKLAGLQVKDVGSAVACLVPVVLWIGLDRGGPWRLAALAFAGVGALALVVVGSKAGGAGLLAAALAALGVQGARRGRWFPFAGAMALVVAAVVAAFAWWPAVGELGLPTVLVNPARQGIWHFVAGYVATAPLFGHGIDVANLLPGAAEIVPGTRFARVPSHPHNWLLEVLVETGVAGLVALLAVLGALAVRLWRVGGTAAVAGLALMASFWTSSLVNFSVWSAWWQWTFVVLVALVLATPAVAPPAARG